MHPPTKPVAISPDAICAATEALRVLRESFTGFEDEGSTAKQIAPVVAKALGEFEKLRRFLQPEEQWTIPSLAGTMADSPLSRKGRAIVTGEYWDRREYFDSLPPEKSPIPGGIVKGLRDRSDYFDNKTGPQS